MTILAERPIVPPRHREPRYAVQYLLSSGAWSARPLPVSDCLDVAVLYASTASCRTRVVFHDGQGWQVRRTVSGWATP